MLHSEQEANSKDSKHTFPDLFSPRGE